jgi:hypothetical protein
MRIAYLACLLLGDLIILLSPAGDVRSAAVFCILWVLPGLGWGILLRRRWLIGLGLGIAVNILLALLLHYLPGPIPFALAMTIFSVAALLPAVLALRVDPTGFRIHPSRALLAIALLAALFRLPSLGYSEFQGDEGVIMVRAAAALEGDDQELFLHQKGPVEILVPLASWSLGGKIDEFWARMPFAWASILGVLAVTQLGRRWFGHHAGWIAGLILSIAGFHVAFGRIVQYQSMVVLFALLALLALDRTPAGRRGVDLSLGAVFLACGSLTHYDVVLFLPAAALLGLTAVLGNRFAGRWRQLLLPVLLGGAIVASFYVPYVMAPSFGKTASYLSQDRVGTGLYVDLGRAWTMSTVYNSSYAVILLLALVVASVGYRSRDRRRALAAWLVFLAPAAFYLVVVFDPRTHLYTLFPGAALLGGAGAMFLRDHLSHRLGRRVALAAGIGLYALCAGYVWLVFVSHSPEYQRTFPDNKSPVYWTTYDEMPAFGRFGFPHRAGWDAVGDLIAQGRIRGVYASNEEQEITDWYTKQAPRTHCSGPDVYIVAENVQDEIPIDHAEVERDYRLAGSVQVGGEPRIRWYVRADSADVGTAVEVDGKNFRQWWQPAEVAPPTTGGTIPADVTLAGMVKLVGYDLDASQAWPGGRLRVTLYWQPLVPLARNYQVFTHLYDGQMWGQHDGAPECAINPTTRWEPGQVIPDPHEIDIAADTPPGQIPLLVGMYDLITRDRLAVPESSDDAILLAEIPIGDGPP